MPQPKPTEQSPQYLLIKLQTIQFHSTKTIKDYEFVYFSFSIPGRDRMYFSSCIDSKILTLSDDIVIPITGDLPDIVELHRWENHMIMFTHEIDVSQLKTRSTTKKKYETKAGEILSFMVLVLGEQELKFGDKYVQSISQHYFIIQKMYFKENRTQTRVDPGPSYYLIRASGSDYVMPVLDGEICIKLPQTLQFEHIRNGKSAGKSRQYTSDQLKQNNIQIELLSESSTTSLNLKVKWGINFFQTKSENILLLEAHELLIYDIQVKFDSYNEYSNSKVKFVYGNKGFEVGSQFNTAKPGKIKKIVYFIIKSQDQEVGIFVERNLKVVAQSRFYTDQISSYMVHTPKRKFIDDNGKIVGSIKFKCEKAKNLSTPNSNPFWKQCSKKKLPNTILLSISQLSLSYQKNQPVSITIKTETQERTVSNVPNFLFFDKEVEISYVPVVVSAKPDQSVYLMVKRDEEHGQGQGQGQGGGQVNQGDFVGIAVLDFGELRLGVNSTQVQFFKNQAKTATGYCLINKVTSYPFVKPSFQPQNLTQNSHKTMSLSILMKKVTFTPYFYTYRYDNKNEVYCIVQANRLKKVLIMQTSTHDDLTFSPSSSSDSLSFHIEDAEYIKVKVTFLVSDVGHQQEIYGSAVVKMKIGEIGGVDGLGFNRVELRNDFGCQVGVIGLEVHEGVLNASRAKKQIENITGPFKSDIKRVQNDLNKIHQNMQIMQQSLKKKPKNSQKLRKSEQTPAQNHNHNQQQNNLKKSARYNNSIDYSNKRKQRNHSVAGTNNDSIKLPYIKENRSKQKNNLKDLVNMMKIRKRDPHGYYQENSNLQPYQGKYPASQREEYVVANRSHQYDPPFQTEQGSRENQNLQRSLEIGFPHMKVKKQRQDIQNQILEYEEKLRKLKNQLTVHEEQDQQEFLDRKMQNIEPEKDYQMKLQQLEMEDN